MEQLNLFTFFKYTWPIFAFYWWLFRGYFKERAQERRNLEEAKKWCEEYNKRRKEVTQDGNERSEDRKVLEESKNEACSKRARNSRPPAT